MSRARASSPLGSIWTILAVVCIGVMIQGGPLLFRGIAAGIVLALGVPLALNAVMGRHCLNCGMPSLVASPRDKRFRRCTICGCHWRRNLILGWREVDPEEDTEPLPAAAPADPWSGRPILEPGERHDGTQGQLLKNKQGRQAPRARKNPPDLNADRDAPTQSS